MYVNIYEWKSYTQTHTHTHSLTPLMYDTKNSVIRKNTHQNQIGPLLINTPDPIGTDGTDVDLFEST